MTSKQTILVIENAVDITGSLNSILRSSIALRDRYDFVFVLPKGSKVLGHVTREGFDVHELPMKEIRKSASSLLLYLPRLLLNAYRLGRLIRSYRNIGLILNNDFYNLIPVAYRLFGGKVSYVCYVRFLPAKFPRLLVSLWNSAHLRYAKRIVAVSHAVESQLPVHSKIEVIWNELPLTHAVFTLSDSKMILYPANFIKGKGHEVALRTFAAAATGTDEWKLRFIGSDMGLQKNRAYRDALIAESEALGVRNKVEFLDHDDNVIAHYKACQFVLNFSESESFSMTCLEAMYYGRPIIATKCGGPSEIIDDSSTGILVDLGDLAAMERSIKVLMTNKDAREVMSATAYYNVRKKFSAANSIEKLARVYQSSLLK